MTEVDPLSRIASLLADLSRTGRTVGRDGKEHDLFPLSIPEAEGDLLREWVVRERATTTIEVGLGHAISALFICSGLLRNAGGRGHHVAIDPNQSSRFGNIGLALLERAGARGIVEHLADDSQIALPRLLADGRRFDFAFVDGNHRFDGVFVDLVYLGRLLEGGSVIFLDDYQLPAIARAVSFFVTNLEWTIEQVGTADERHGWAVLRTRREPKDRPFHYFVDF